MPIDMQNASELEGVSVLGTQDDKLGKVDSIYFDNMTSQPAWASVKTGLFGSNVSLIPLAQADFDGQDLRVPYSKDQLKDAPHHDPGTELTPENEQDLYAHYSLDYGQSASYGQDSSAAGEAGVEGYDTSGPTTDEAMTRSEERLHVGTETQEVGTARLRKHIVTENVTQTVPVSREEVVLEREPITEENRDAAMAGGDLTEEEHEVTLTEERVVVSKETVPVERVRIGTQTVTGEETVSEEIRKEQIETDGVTDNGEGYTEHIQGERIQAEDADAEARLR